MIYTRERVAAYHTALSYIIDPVWVHAIVNKFPHTGSVTDLTTRIPRILPKHPQDGTLTFSYRYGIHLDPQDYDGVCTHENSVSAPCPEAPAILLSHARYNKQVDGSISLYANMVDLSHCQNADGSFNEYGCGETITPISAVCMGSVDAHLNSEGYFHRVGASAFHARSVLIHAPWGHSYPDHLPYLIEILGLHVYMEHGRYHSHEFQSIRFHNLYIRNPDFTGYDDLMKTKVKADPFRPGLGLTPKSEYGMMTYIDSLKVRK